MATSGTSVLKEFLVKIGFRVDETKFRHFQEAMRTTARGALEMSRTLAKIGAATAAGVTGSSLAVKSVADGLTGLYYSAQRTGSTVKQLKELQYAFEQVGLSADQAQQTVEALAASRRTNPGLNGILGSMGIDPRQTDNAKVMLELVGKLGQMPYYQATQIGGIFGINDAALYQMRTHGPEFVKALKQSEAMFKKQGYDPDTAAKQSVELDRKWNEVKQKFKMLGEQMAVDLYPAVRSLAIGLENLLTWFLKVDKETGGWAMKLGAVALALAPVVTATGVIAAGSALGGIATAAGSTITAILGMISWPVVIALAVAAVAAYFAFSKHGREMVSHAAHSIKDATVSAWKASGIGPSLTRMVQSFEGHARHGYGLYRDAAGRLTAGFGHLVRPGEDLAGLNQQGATSLLARDLAKARAAVLRFVKVALTGNQLDALTDFEFNVGQRNFARSTLLRLLNGGNYLAAADQFQYWNHALVNGHMMALAGLTARRAAEANLFRAPDRAVQVTQTNEYHVTSTDPRGAGAEIERRQARMTADLVRNMQGAYR